MKRFELVARECLEYSIDTGWEISDWDEVKSDYPSKEAALAGQSDFVSSLKIYPNQVFEIRLNEFTYETNDNGEIDEYCKPDLEVETLDIIDPSYNNPKPVFVACQYHGTYMICQNKWQIIYNKFNLSANELCLVTEYSSYKYHPKACFQTEDEVEEYINENNLNVVYCIFNLNEK